MNYTSKIRIAFFIDSMNSIAGTEKQILNIIKHINSKEFKIYLFALRAPSAHFQKDDLPINYVELKVVSLLSLNSLLSLLHTSLLLRRLKIDIVQTFFIDSNIFGVLCAKLAGINKIVISRRDLGFWYNKKILLLLKFINYFATHFLANSYAVKKNIIQYEKINPSIINVIYNGINNTKYNNDVSNNNSNSIFYHSNQFFIGSNEKFKSYLKNTKKETSISTESLIIGTVANFTRFVKRVDIFIITAAILLKKYEHLKFVIIGGGYLEDKLKRTVKGLNISDKCIFLGIQNDVRSIIKNWDIGVITSESEGFCNSILEYMAEGLPVVATNVGGNPELISNNLSGFLVPPNKPLEISNAISVLIENSSLRREMGEYGNLIVRTRFNWQIISKEYQNYYNQILTTPSKLTRPSDGIDRLLE